MNIIENLQNNLVSFLKKEFSLETLPSNIEFPLNTDPEKQKFGDLNSNAAMVLAKQLKQNPRQIAEKIKSSFKDDSIEKIEIAGPGFLNFFIKDEVYKKITQKIFSQKEQFFASPPEKQHNYNVEFVSANPTGPLHIGHGRGGIIGDVLGKILSFIGHNVTKEFYINDAGSQINKFGISFKIRYLQALGQDVEFPEDGYHGNYLKELAKETFEADGADLSGQPDYYFAEYAYKKMLGKIKETLTNYGIEFDVWFSEKTLHKNGEIEKALEILDNNKFLYEKDGALWFKATEFGDDKDRALKKSDGDYTYVAADTAYMLDKADRKFDKQILVLGQDHHSYVTRLNGLRQALGIKDCSVEVILYQLVTLKEGDELLKMSKRAGTMVSLEDVIEAVGKDAARYFYLNRKADAHLDFDIDLAMKKSDENPVYYIQYAFVRTKSILEKSEDIEELKEISSDSILEINEYEKKLIKKIIALRGLLVHIGKTYQTHLLSYYTYELAQEFHRYYSKNRVIDKENIDQSKSRLAIINILKNTFELCLNLLGVSAPNKM